MKKGGKHNAMKKKSTQEKRTGKKGTEKRGRKKGPGKKGPVPFFLNFVKKQAEKQISLI